MNAEFGWLARIYLLLLLAGLPVLAVRGAPEDEEIRDLAGSRRLLYVSTAVSLAVLAAVTWGVAAWAGIEPESLGWRAGEPAVLAGWTVATAAAGMAAVWLVSRLGRALGARESPLVRLLIPTTRAGRGSFVLLSAAAGVFEEYVFRGFILWGLAGWTGSVWLAAALAGVSFGVAHGYQRLVGIARASILGLVLAVPVIRTGSLFPAMVAHFWINAVIGLGGWRWLVETEGPPEGPRPPDPGASES